MIHTRRDQIWDLREGHLCYTLHGHEGAVNSVAFSPAVMQPQNPNTASLGTQPHVKSLRSSYMGIQVYPHVG